MDESEYIIRIFYKSRVIIPIKEKETIKSIDSKREWVINIDTINSVGIAFKDFFVTKDKNVFRNFINYIIESDYTIAVTDNR
jgi:hypothetical protein